MTSLEIINNDIRHYENACLKAYDYKGEQLSKLYQIKQDLEVLKIFKNYISLSYIKNLISENKFSLNNFDWDIKDEKIIINRIKELKVLVKFLETNKVGDNNA